MQKINSLLLIDDNPDINRLNQIIVKDLAAAKEVHIVKDEQVALDLIGSGQISPDVIITDVNLLNIDNSGFLTTYSQLSTCGEKSSVFVSSNTNSFAKLEQILAINVVREQIEKSILIGIQQRLHLASDN